MNNVYKLVPKWFKIGFYKFGGKKPWSRGYTTFKFEYIKKIINNREIMERFKNLESLPKGYGYALDERVVEYPWALSRVPESDSGCLLDAGSSLNFQEILEHKNLKNKKITIVNLNPESNCFWQKGISYVFDDIRNLSFKDNCFDLITCISALEHVGMDNILYTNDSKYREEKIFDFEKAILEMKRVLKKGGRLLITVPFGKYKNFGRFQQFDIKPINNILEVFKLEKFQVDYYKYTKEGWNISDEISCQDCEFFDVFKTKHFDKNSNKDFDSDFAAASRAIACLELFK